VRTIIGDIALPANCPEFREAVVLIEVRDVSLADAPSLVVAHTQLKGVTIKPGAFVPFSLGVPEVPDARSLELRIHISLSNSDQVKHGDLLTTTSIPIPSRGVPGYTIVPVTLV
jgi:uncharacterized lipoprotein YbaY